MENRLNKCPLCDGNLFQTIADKETVYICLLCDSVISDLEYSEGILGCEDNEDGGMTIRWLSHWCATDKEVSNLIADRDIITIVCQLRNSRCIDMAIRAMHFDGAKMIPTKSGLVIMMRKHGFILKDISPGKLIFTKE